jgi:fructokinase
LALEHVESATPMLRSGKVVHLGSSSLSKDPARTATWRAVALAKEHSCLLSCDPNLRLHIWRDKAEAIQMTHRLISLADILKISDDEAEVLFGTRDPARAAALVHKAGPKVVTVTLGANGAYLSAPTFQGFAPAHSVQVVDTTGAGDGFCAGLLSLIAPALGDDLRLSSISSEVFSLALQRGNRVGGAVVAALGATPGLPKLAEL